MEDRTCRSKTVVLTTGYHTKEDVNSHVKTGSSFTNALVTNGRPILIMKPERVVPSNTGEMWPRRNIVPRSKGLMRKRAPVDPGRLYRRDDMAGTRKKFPVLTPVADVKGP